MAESRDELITEIARETGLDCMAESRDELEAIEDDG
jgi:hypothetical protein